MNDLSPNESFQNARLFIMLSSFNYLDLSQDPDSSIAAQEAVQHVWSQLDRVTIERTHNDQELMKCLQSYKIKDIQFRSDQVYNNHVFFRGFIRRHCHSWITAFYYWRIDPRVMHRKSLIWARFRNGCWESQWIYLMRLIQTDGVFSMDAT